ncbi:TPA: hypothetical protein J5F84_004444 [Escherichia coli]|nr:hypothetical protein [Escherichia coli]
MQATKGFVRGWITWGDEWEQYVEDDRRSKGAVLLLRTTGRYADGMGLALEHIRIDGRCNQPGFNHRAMHKCLKQQGVQTTYFEGPLQGFLEVNKTGKTNLELAWAADSCPNCKARIDIEFRDYSEVNPPISRNECKVTTPGNMYFNFDVRNTQLATYGVNKTQKLKIDCPDGDGALIKIQPPGTIQAGPIAAQVDVGGGAAQSKYYNLQKGINYINVTVSAEPTDAEPGRYEGSGVMVVLQE